MLSSSLFRLLVGAIFVLYHQDVAFAQIPAVCVSNENLLSRECCPSAANGMQCGGPNQGECTNVSSVCKTDYTSGEVQVSEYTDLRFNWSIGFFDRVCKCKNNFGDFDCGRCKFGYEFEGGSCVKAGNRMRKSVSSMSESDWITYNMRLTVDTRYISEVTTLWQVTIVMCHYMILWYGCIITLLAQMEG